MAASSPHHQGAAAADAVRRKQLAAIHIAASDLGMPDDAYRMRVRLHSGGVQQADGSVVGGCDSAADLTTTQRLALLADLRQRGERSGRAPRRGRRAPAKAPARQVRRGPDGVAAAKAALAGKIEALLLDGGRGDAYAASIARSRFGVTRWEWLPFHQMEDLMQMLIIDQQRRAMRRGLAALAAGRTWWADLTAGEIEHGVDMAAARRAHQRGLVSSPTGGIDAGDLSDLVLTERGRQAVAS